MLPRPARSQRRAAPRTYAAEPAVQEGPVEECVRERLLVLDCREHLQHFLRHLPDLVSVVITHKHKSHQQVIAALAFGCIIKVVFLSWNSLESHLGYPVGFRGYLLV